MAELVNAIHRLRTGPYNGKKNLTIYLDLEYRQSTKSQKKSHNSWDIFFRLEQDKSDKK